MESNREFGLSCALALPLHDDGSIEAQQAKDLGTACDALFRE